MMVDVTPRALDLANPSAPEYLWEPKGDGLRGRIFVFGYAGYFCAADFVFFKGSDPSKRSMYRILTKTDGANDNHQWSAELEYMADPPDKYELFPPLGQTMMME